MFYNRVGFGKTLNSQVDPQRQNIPIIGMDQSFSSISEAARYVGVSVSTIQSRLAKKHPDWTYAKTYKKVATRVARPVVIDQTDYISVSSAGQQWGM
jgi:hypothetical protein